MNEAAEFCLFSLCITNIKIMFGNVFAKQGQDFSTANISVSKSTPPSPKYDLGAVTRPIGLELCKVFVIPEINHTSQGDWQMGKLITRCFSAIPCTGSAPLGEGTADTLSKAHLKQPDLSCHFRASEMGTGCKLKAAN